MPVEEHTFTDMMTLQEHTFTDMMTAHVYIMISTYATVITHLSKSMLHTTHISPSRSRSTQINISGGEVYWCLLLFYSESIRKYWRFTLIHSRLNIRRFVHQKILKKTNTRRLEKIIWKKYKNTILISFSGFFCMTEHGFFRNTPGGRCLCNNVQL